MKRRSVKIIKIYFKFYSEFYELKVKSSYYKAWFNLIIYTLSLVKISYLKYIYGIKYIVTRSLWIAQCK